MYSDAAPWVSDLGSLTCTEVRHRLLQPLALLLHMVTLEVVGQLFGMVASIDISPDEPAPSFLCVTPRDGDVGQLDQRGIPVLRWQVAGGCQDTAELPFRLSEALQAHEAHRRIATSADDLPYHSEALVALAGVSIVPACFLKPTGLSAGEPELMDGASLTFRQPCSVIEGNGVSGRLDRLLVVAQPALAHALVAEAASQQLQFLWTEGSEATDGEERFQEPECGEGSLVVPGQEGAPGHPPHGSEATALNKRPFQPNTFGHVLRSGLIDSLEHVWIVEEQPGLAVGLTDGGPDFEREVVGKDAFHLVPGRQRTAFP
jgi:hypothetical protein